jgi:hypothetical protein
MGRLQYSKVVGKLACGNGPLYQRVASEAEDALQIITQNPTGKQSFELNDQLMHWDCAVLVLVLFQTDQAKKGVSN